MRAHSPGADVGAASEDLIRPSPFPKTTPLFGAIVAPDSRLTCSALASRMHFKADLKPMSPRHA